MKNNQPIVSIHQCDDYSEENVQRAVDLSLSDIGGIESFISSGDRVLLKPNLLIGKPPDKELNTRAEVVKAVMARAADCGAKLVVGDSPSFGSAASAAKKCGILDVAKSFGAEVVTFKDTREVSSENGRMYKQLPIASDALDADKVINLPKLKTHGFMTLTLGVKNLFGCIVGRAKPQWHLKAGQNAVAFARMLVEIDAAVAPALTLMDGVVGMEGNGPGSGDPKKVGVIMASPSALALDRVTLDLLHMTPDQLPLLDAAREFGVSGTEMSEIELKGEAISSIRVRGFKLPPTPERQINHLPAFLQRMIKRTFTTEPLIHNDKCTRCATCIKACPPEVMSFVPLEKTDKNGYDKKVEIDRTGCIHCFCCQEVCPEGAITIRRGLLLKSAARS